MLEKLWWMVNKMHSTLVWFLKEAILELTDYLNSSLSWNVPEEPDILKENICFTPFCSRRESQFKWCFCVHLRLPSVVYSRNNVFQHQTSFLLKPYDNPCSAPTLLCVWVYLELWCHSAAAPLIMGQNNNGSFLVFALSSLWQWQRRPWPLPRTWLTW